MFSSEQKFVISGDNKENLKKAIEFALDYGEIKQIKNFYIDEHGYLVFCNFKSGDIGTDYVFNVTPTVLVEHIYDYIDNLSPEEIEQITGEEIDSDGDILLGWELFHPSWYEEYEIESYRLNVVLACKPCWVVYGK